MAARLPHTTLPEPRRSVESDSGPGRLAVDVRRVGHWAVLLGARGEVDLRTAPALRQDLMAALRTPDLLVLVLDLTEVAFLAAAGLTVLVEVRDRARELAVELRVVATGRAVLRPLDVTGLRDTFRLHTDAGSALAPHVHAA